jgi:hypothetical protein
LRNRRTSSDSLPVAGFKELLARETVEAIISKLLNIHTQKISKGIQTLPSGDIRSISFGRIMTKVDAGNKASMFRYKATVEINMFRLQLKVS